MTRETKVGLLVGMGVILLIGIIVSDHLSMAQKQTPPDMTDFGSTAQSSLNAQGTGMQTLPVTDAPAAPVAPSQPLPTPAQFEHHTQFANQQPAPATIAIPQGYMPAPVARVEQSGPDEVAAAMDAHLNQPPVANRIAAATIRPNADFDNAALVSSVNVTPRTSQGPQPAIHYVQRNETLYAIAARYYNDGELWHIIRDANKNAVRDDNTVNLGARLIIPNKALLPDLLRQNPQASALLTQVQRESAPIASTPRTIIVQQGDTLSGIASKYLGTSRRWKELLEANKDKMDKPQDLRVGMTINLPGTTGTQSGPQSVTQTPAQSTTQSPSASGNQSSAASSVNNIYTVQPGDTLSRIAEKSLGDGNLWDSIFQANRKQLKNANDLAPGMKLNIPVQR